MCNKSFIVVFAQQFLALREFVQNFAKTSFRKKPSWRQITLHLASLMAQPFILAHMVP